MRAIVAKKFGGTDVLERQEVSLPEIGPNDLLVEVYASSINPVDTKARTHGLGLLTPPLILGFDFSGVVKALGKNAMSSFKEGDEVFGFASLIRQGAHAEFIATDYRSCAKKPLGLSHVQAGSLPIAVLTAWEALYDRMNLPISSTILIHAGGGGVGHIAIQLAKSRNCRVITTASSEDSRSLCQDLGADVIINHREEDFVQRVLAETQGKGCAYILDSVGGDVFERSLDCLQVCGSIATIVEGSSPLIHEKLFVKNASAHFVFIGALVINETNPEHQGEVLAKVAKLVVDKKLHPHISRFLSFDEIPKGHDLQESGHVVGKISVRIKE